MSTTSLAQTTILTHNSSFFTEESLSLLKQIMYPLQVNDQACLFREGDNSNKLYFIYSGRVKLTKLTDYGKEYIFSLYHSGDFFGQIDPLSDSTHTFSAFASEDCQIGVIQKTDLEVLLWQQGQLAIEFVRLMGYMHRITQTKVRDFTMFGKTGALSSLLIRLANSYGTLKNDGILITLKLTNAELSDFIGAARESVNRMLSEWKRLGLLSIHDGYITITDLKALQSICKCENCPVDICRV